MTWNGNRNLLLVWASLVAGTCLAVGCAATDEALTSQQAEAESDQKYDYDYVKKQVSRLSPGMSKAEVLITLGSPAQRQAARWIYRPKRSGLIVPAEALVVRFQQGVYVSHSFEPIVLGERVGEQ